MNELAAMLSAELWAIEPRALEQLTMAAASSIGAFHVDTPEREPYAVVDGVATIAIHGPMMPKVSPILAFFGIEATDTYATTAAVKAAANDGDVDSISLEIDSPGGAVRGVTDLSDAIHAARQLKPVHASTGGIMASAALWVGSQAQTITATRGSMIGSIGAVTSINDTSEQAKAAGVKVNVVSSAPLKAAGMDGAPVTDKHLAEVKRMVDDVAALFVADVARGRGITTAAAEKLATGQVWFAAEAQAKGLIDKISTPFTSSGATTNQAPSAHGGSAMTPEEMQAQLAKMQTDLEAANALAATATAQAAESGEAAKLAGDLLAAEQTKAKAAIAARVDGIIKANANKITPDKIEAAQKYAAFCGEDVAAFEGHVAMLPVVIRDEPNSQAPDGDNADKPEAKAAHPDAAEIAETHGLSIEAVEAAIDVVAVAHTGKALGADGAEKVVN